MIKNRYAVTWWTVDDIKDRRPKWTRKQCAAWLDRYEEPTVRLATEAVIELIEFLLAKEK